MLHYERRIVLVPGCSTVSESANMAPVDIVSISIVGRRAEHGVSGLAVVLISRAVPVLLGCAKAGWIVGARRSGGGRSSDVGAGVDRLSAAAIFDWSKLFIRFEARQKETARPIANAAPRCNISATAYPRRATTQAEGAHL